MTDAAHPAWGRRRVIMLLLVFVALFVVLVAITFPDGRATTFEGIRATATADEATPLMGRHDSRHYIEVGKDLGVNHAVAEEHRWILNYWPPGLHVFYAALFAIFGPDMSVGLAAGVALAALWAGALTLWADLLARFLPAWAVVLVLGAILLSNTTHDWIFGLGLFWSEGLYTWTMFLALYAATRLAMAGTERARLAWAAAVGLALGASAYVRTTSELLGRVFTVLVVAWAVCALAHRGLRRLRSRGGRKLPPLHSWNRQLLALSLCVIVFHVVTVPWRIIAAERFRPDNYAWSTVTNRYWHHQWMPDRVLRERRNFFLLEGGANTACKIAPKKCREIATQELRRPAAFTGAGYYSEKQFRRFALDTMKAHPVEWADRRIRMLPAVWFTSTVAASGDYRPASEFFVILGPEAHSHEILQNGLLLATLAALLALTIARIRRVGPDLLSLIIPTLLVVVTAPGIVLHWEGRYYLPLKVLIIIAFAALLALELQARRQSGPPRPTGTDGAEPARA